MSTIQTVLNTDKLKDWKDKINTNFDNLNTDKVEISWEKTTELVDDDRILIKDSEDNNKYKEINPSILCDKCNTPAPIVFEDCNIIQDKCNYSTQSSSQSPVNNVISDWTYIYNFSALYTDDKYNSFTKTEISTWDIIVNKKFYFTLSNNAVAAIQINTLFFYDNYIYIVWFYKAWVDWYIIKLDKDWNLVDTLYSSDFTKPTSWVTSRYREPYYIDWNILTFTTTAWADWTVAYKIKINLDDLTIQDEKTFPNYFWFRQISSWTSNNIYNVDDNLDIISACKLNYSDFWFINLTTFNWYKITDDWWNNELLNTIIKDWQNYYIWTNSWRLYKLDNNFNILNIYQISNSSTSYVWISWIK